MGTSGKGRKLFSKEAGTILEVKEREEWDKEEDRQSCAVLLFGMDLIGKKEQE